MLVQAADVTLDRAAASIADQVVGSTAVPEAACIQDQAADSTPVPEVVCTLGRVEESMQVRPIRTIKTLTKVHGVPVLPEFSGRHGLVKTALDE